MKIEKLKSRNCTILIQREIHTVASRAAPGDLGLKSHPKDYQQKLTYWYGRLFHNSLLHFLGSINPNKFIPKCLSIIVILWGWHTTPFIHNRDFNMLWLLWYVEIWQCLSGICKFFEIISDEVFKSLSKMSIKLLSIYFLFSYTVFKYDLTKILPSK